MSFVYFFVGLSHASISVASETATAHNMDMSAANDVLTYDDVTALPSAAMWTDEYVADSATVKHDLFYRLSGCSTVQNGFTDDSVTAVQSDGSDLLSDRLQWDNVSSSSCYGASSGSAPYCWNDASAGQSTTFAGSLSCSESTSILSDSISVCHPVSAGVSPDVNSSSTMNGIHIVALFNDL